ncbi:MAG TPA: sigma-70 family RNA polymerase sigma factor, partial [Gemmataceae bacterium]|nr:sigma-70 family RNA polymerase sigma factor [Gemmataceae bacterium]
MMFQCDCPPDDCAGRVRLHLAGDREAGDALARKFAGLVRSIVQRVLGPGRREEWDDACQAVFLRVFTNLGKWEERCPFCKWLAVVAARRAIDLVRLIEPATPHLQGDVADLRPAPPDP